MNGELFSMFLDNDFEGMKVELDEMIVSVLWKMSLSMKKFNWIEISRKYKNTGEND